MKKYIATINALVDADSLEARDAVVSLLVRTINSCESAVRVDKKSSAAVRFAALSRIRPKSARVATQKSKKR